MGEPAGIGGELSLKAWLARQRGDAAVLRARRSCAPGRARPQARPRRAGAGDRAAGRSRPLSSRRRCPCCRCACARRRAAGHPDPANAPATLEAIERAASLGAGRRDRRHGDQSDPEEDAAGRGLPPSRPHRIPGRAGGRRRRRHDAGLPRTARRAGDHPPLARRGGAHARHRDVIVRAGRIAAAGLKSLFGIDRPRLAVAGLNPHAGEQGAMGDEESRHHRAGHRQR